MTLPVIIQGGMGVAISDWRLARAVSTVGQLGVVSGTAIARIFASRLLDGDPRGDIRRAMAAFPFQDVAEQILTRYFIAGGKPANEPYKTIPVYTIKPSKFLDQLTAVANFVEVYLAKEGHSGVVGINLLEKIQMPNLASLYGALLAGVDYVLMGAGIPTQVAGVLDRLTKHEPVKYRVDVTGASADEQYFQHFDPEKVFEGLDISSLPLKRPLFLPIISSSTLANALIKRSDGEVNGFVIETPIAGGHNAPPRGALRLNDEGEPIYGDRDIADTEQVRALGLPFWMAGGYGHPDKLDDAIALGAAGIQVGTAFSLCEESGMADPIKRKVLRRVFDNTAGVHTSSRMSPTGFPFKVARLDESVANPEVLAKRNRICDLSFLRSVVKVESGKIDYRCASEPEDDFIRKGGKMDETPGRSCLCNNLVATAGFAQTRKDGYVEPPLVTSGDDLPSVRALISEEKLRYSAAELVTFLLGKRVGGTTNVNEKNGVHKNGSSLNGAHSNGSSVNGSHNGVSSSTNGHIAAIAIDTILA